MRRSAAALVIAVASWFGLSAVGARSAQAFCQTTTCDKCVIPATGCVTDGFPLYWPGGCVSYDLQQDASKWASLDVATGIVDGAFAAWAAVTCGGQAPSITFMNRGPVACDKREFNDGVHTAGGNANIVVFRDTVWTETAVSDPASTLALTTVTFNKTNGQIVDADIEINGTENPLSTSQDVMAGGFDLASILAHETGHFVGLAHSTEPCSADGHDCPTMNGQYRRGSIAYRTLEPDDQAGLCAIYPPGRTVGDKTCTPVAGFSNVCGHAPDPQGGCATGGGADVPRGALVGMAALALAIVTRFRTGQRR